jgi:hypothetical protein
MTPLVLEAGALFAMTLNQVLVDVPPAPIKQFAFPPAVKPVTLIDLAYAPPPAPYPLFTPDDAPSPIASTDTNPIKSEGTVN